MEHNTEPAAFAPQRPWHPLAPAYALSGWPMETGRAQGYLLLGSSPETTCAQTGSDFPQAGTIQARTDVLLHGDTERARSVQPYTPSVPTLRAKNRVTPLWELLPGERTSCSSSRATHLL